jgi:hypothetical protein
VLQLLLDPHHALAQFDLVHGGGACPAIARPAIRPDAA